MYVCVSSRVMSPTARLPGSVVEEADIGTVLGQSGKDLPRNRWLLIAGGGGGSVQRSCR